MKALTLTKIVTVLFVLIVILDCVGIITEDMTWRYIFKPLIAPTLLVLYFLETAKVERLFVLALCFAFIADVLLLNSSNTFFLIALGLFLSMMLTYITIITKTVHKYNTKNLILAGIPFFTVLVFVIFFASKNIANFLWPILVYGIVVCIFSALAFYCYLENKTNTCLLLLLGSFFFIISNSMSAIEKFRLENKDLAVPIMLTYALAQFLIYRYMVQISRHDIDR